MNIFEEIKQDVKGIEALDDWLGDGGRAVAPMLAEFRAQRCVSGNNGQPCPLNSHPRWWEHSKEIVALYIRKQLEIKNSMSMRVSTEENLHLCKACGCCLPLKVHVPLSHIRDHTPREALSKMPDWCWIKSELSQIPL